MNSSTLIGSGAISLSAITNNSVNETGEIDKTKRNEYLATTIATTATVVAGYSINDATVRQIHNKYSHSYVDSLSDKELERALQQMNLLAENDSKEIVKTL